MTPIHVTFVCEPDVRLHDPGWEPERYTSFLAALARRLGHDVPLVQTRLCDVQPLNGFVILETNDLDQSLLQCLPAERTELARRVVLIYPRRGRGTVHEQIERLSIAAAIDSSVIIQWESLSATEKWIHGLTGKREMAPLIDANCMDDLMMPPAGYCFLMSRKHDDLPHLFAEYLRCLQSSYSPGKAII